MNLLIKIDGVGMTPIGEGIKYVINSPAFSGKAIAGDFSYPLSFANIPEHRKVFDFIDRDDVFLETIEKPCEIYLDNNLFLTAKFQITKTTKEVVTGKIINAGSYFYRKTKKHNLSDLNLFSNTFPSEYDKYQWLYDTVNHSYPDRPVTIFPVMNSYDNSTTVTDDDGNGYTFTIGNIINNMQETSPGVLEFGYPNRIAFPYIAYIIEQIFITYGIHLKTNVFAEDSELSRLVLLNYIKNNSTRNDLDPSGNVFDLKDHIAKIYIQDFLNYLSGFIAHAYFIDFQNSETESVFLKDLLIPGNYIDWTDKVVNFNEKEYKHEDRGFFLFQDFQDDIMNDKQYEYDRGVNLVADYIADTPAELPYNASPGEIGFVKADNAWYQYGFLGNNQGLQIWRFLTWNFFGVKTNNAGTEKGSKITTAGMYWYDRNSGRLDMSKSSQTNIWMIPQVGLKVIDSWAAWKLLTPEPRIVFYRGVQNAMDDNGNYTVDYPLGTSGNTDAEGNVIGSLKLQWGGNDGLKANYWEEWLNFIDNPKSFKFDLALNLLDILNLDLKKQVKINNNFYLIRKLTIDFPIKGVVKAEMVKV